MSARSVALALSSVFIATACHDGNSRWTGTMYDSAGVTIVSNTDIGVWAPGEEWTVEEELRIGAVAGNPDYQFGEIGGVAVDSRDRVFVLDVMAQHIRVYSPDGVFQQTVGAPGGGPGELRGAVSVLMGPGDTLLVQDNRNYRFNRYSPDGSSAGGFRLELEERRPKLFKASTSGEIAEHFESRGSSGQPGIQDPKDGILLLAADGTAIDTMLTFPSLFAGRGYNFYVPEMMWDLTGDVGLFCGINDEFRLAIYSNRRLERIITKPFDRRPVGEMEIEALRERFYAGAPASAPREALDRMWGGANVADVFPAFQDVAVGRMGSLWVQRVQAAAELSGEEDFSLFDGGAPEWDVFDSQGRLLGVVVMPRRFEPMVFRGDQIYGVWHDEFDVQYVVRLRVVGDFAAAEW